MNLRSVLLVSALAVVGAAQADLTPITLASGNYLQSWTNTGLISTDDNWSGVTGVVGYRGDDTTVTAAITTSAALYVSPANMQPVDVNANQTAPNTFATGGVTEFELTDPTVAIYGSGTADRPTLLFNFDTTGRTDVNLSVRLRDLETGADNAVQQISIQYRIGNSGNFTSLAGGYVADATTGPNTAGPDILLSNLSDASWTNVPLLQIRFVTFNALGNDEAVGIDDVSVTSVAQAVPEPSAFAALGLGAVALLRRRRSVK